MSKETKNKALDKHLIDATEQVADTIDGNNVDLFYRRYGIVDALMRLSGGEGLNLYSDGERIPPDEMDPKIDAGNGEVFYRDGKPFTGVIDPQGKTLREVLGEVASDYFMDLYVQVARAAAREDRDIKYINFALLLNHDYSENGDYSLGTELSIPQLIANEVNVRNKKDKNKSDKHDENKITEDDVEKLLRMVEGSEYYPSERTKFFELYDKLKKVFKKRKEEGKKSKATTLELADAWASAILYVNVLKKLVHEETGFVADGLGIKEKNLSIVLGEEPRSENPIINDIDRFIINIGLARSRGNYGDWDEVYTQLHSTDFLQPEHRPTDDTERAELFERLTGMNMYDVKHTAKAKMSEFKNIKK